MKNSWHQYSKRAAKPDRTGPDGFVYDSKTEMLRGCYLKLLERAGEISDLQRQVRYELSGPSGINITVMAGKKPAVYTPDFLYKDKDGSTVIDKKRFLLRQTV